MRILGIILIVLWLLFGWTLYNEHNNCCNLTNEDDLISDFHEKASNKMGNETLNVDSSIVENNEVSLGSPLLFLRSSAAPILGSNWIYFRDSLAKSLKTNQILEISGNYYTDEKNSSDFENLGLFRANIIAGKFKNIIPIDKIRLTSKLLDGKSSEVSTPFECVNFRNLIQSVKIKQINDFTLIYFPFNSYNKLNDKEIESYLDGVVENLKRTNKRISLTGHTDDIGDTLSNEILGMRRANIIKDYLIKKGIIPSKIFTFSKGEKSPIQSNDSEEGRAKNRRTELKIII